MREQAQFGRRGVGQQYADVNAPEPLPTAPEASPLSPQAEAFRGRLDGAWRTSSPFEQWRRGRQGRFMAAWTVRLVLISPSLFCLTLHLPLQYAGGLGFAGLLTGWWLRRERVRDRAEIKAWDEA